MQASMFFVLSVNQLQQLLHMVICIGPFLTYVVGGGGKDRMLVCFFCHTCPIQLLRVKKFCHRWLSWLSIGLLHGRSCVQLRPDQSNTQGLKITE